MFQRLLLTVVVLFSFSALAAQNNSSSRKKSIAYPLKELLKGIDTLIIQGGPRIIKGENRDTVYTSVIQKLANLYFQDKDFSIESYGVTPTGSISFFSKGERVALIGCWDINDTYYAVNVTIHEQLVYHGLLINKNYMDKLFDRLKKQADD